MRSGRISIEDHLQSDKDKSEEEKQIKQYNKIIDYFNRRLFRNVPRPVRVVPVEKFT